MKVAKCDICGKTAENYYQIKYRRIAKQTVDSIKQVDLCEECFKKADETLQDQQKDVNMMS